ncbi:MAG: DEAD/DEAH box helicase, partial [Blastocatellia bacterium]
MSFRVSEYELPVIPHSACSAPMYPHQVKIWESWDSDPSILLAAKTGTGKTRAAMLPILKRHEWAIAAYPTN